MLEQEQYEQIEIYLAQQMNEAEQQAFEQALAKDDALREALTVHQDMQSLYASKTKDTLRASLQQIRKEFDDNGKALNSRPGFAPEVKRSYRWLWLLLAVATGIAYYVYATAKAVQENPRPITEPTPIQPIEQTPSAPTEGNTHEVESITIPPVERDDKEVSPPAKNLPIAANDEPNPRLEAEIRSFLRGDFQLELQSPVDDQSVSLILGKARFELAGELETELVPEDDFSLFVEIYHNAPNDFEKGQYVTKQELMLEANETLYTVKQKVQFSASPGLYYYLIKDDFGGAVLGGGRLFIKAQ